MQKKEGFKANLLDSHKYSRERERERKREERMRRVPDSNLGF
jgi:hypothetical protein